MLDFQQKRKIKSLAYNRVTLVILFIVVLLVMRSTWVVYKKKQSSQETRNLIQKNVEELRLRSEEIRQKISKLDTVTGIEEEIRLKFNVIKNDENVVIIVDEDNSVASTTDSSHGFWDKIKKMWSW